jgi:hypothetical protein
VCVDVDGVDHGTRKKSGDQIEQADWDKRLIHQVAVLKRGILEVSFL